MKFAWMKDHRSRFSVPFMSRMLGVSPSGFYAWLKRRPSARRRRDDQLALRMRAMFRRSRRTYGAHRLHQDLQAEGERVSRKRVARLMVREGIVARPKRRFRRTTDSAHRRGFAPNHIARNFSSDEPDRVWAADITFIRTWEGWVFLAVLIDVFSRRVVGFALDDSMTDQLTLDALNNAIRQRRPPPGLVHHSDRGSQYASRCYRRALVGVGAVQSMSRAGDCWDNALVESFFSTLKHELIHRYAWPTKRGAISAVTDYIENFYNPYRRHSSIGYESPVGFELNFKRPALAA